MENKIINISNSVIQIMKDRTYGREPITREVYRKTDRLFTGVTAAIYSAYLRGLDRSKTDKLLEELAQIKTEFDERYKADCR